MDVLYLEELTFIIWPVWRFGICICILVVWSHSAI